VASGPTTLTHSYTITNTTSKPIKLVRSINGKPCCGDVEPLKPTSLGPREAAAIKVSLRVGGVIGPVQHLASVEIHGSEKQMVRFSTLANVFPPARIVEAEETFQAPSPGVSTRRAFVVSTFGTQREPPLALDETLLKATAPFSWCGPATERHLDDQLVERTRALWLTLSGVGQPGYRLERVTLQHRDRVLAEYSFQWELRRALVAAPATVVLSAKAGRTRKTVTLRSDDRQEFRVVKIQADGKAVQARWVDPGPSWVKSIPIEVDPLLLGNNTSTEITIQTDHPVQPLAKVLILVVPGSSS
jgi:hypothetical protein